MKAIMVCTPLTPGTLSYIMLIFCQLKLCLAIAIHIFYWLKMTRIYKIKAYRLSVLHFHFY